MTISFLLLDYGGKVKKDEKRDEYKDLARELNNLWNIKVTVIPIAVRACATVPQNLKMTLDEQELIGGIENFHIKTLLKLAEILKRIKYLQRNQIIK